jgi:hypothetical protein
MLFIQNIELSKIIELLSYTIPSVITGLVAYYFFSLYITNETKKMKFNLLQKSKKATLPLKLQAFERMTLFLERINLQKLIVRISSVNNDKDAYAISLIDTIEKEFEHNLAQQIYISDNSWDAIIASKNATIHIIRTTLNLKEIKTAQELREKIIESTTSNPSPSLSALKILKNEIRELI